jgi:hypothetical protein
MARLSLSPTFVKDSLSIFRQRGVKGLLFGQQAEVDSRKLDLVRTVEANPQKFAARVATLHKIDIVHSGKGSVYLLTDPEESNKSVLIFGEQTKITNGPDLWLYLSDSDNPQKSHGSFMNLGLLEGNKGAQVYSVAKPSRELEVYKSVIIYCKQFDVLFSYGLFKK